MSVNKPKNKESQESEDEQEEFLDKNETNYLIKFKLGYNQKSKDITFLFDYSQHNFSQYKTIEKIGNNYFGEKYSEKFLLYYEYLLKAKDALKKKINIIFLY